MSEQQDKIIEKNRYNSKAKNTFYKENKNQKFGSESEIPYLKTPYLFYEKIISRLVKSEHKVLEIGSGTGLYTLPLIKTGAKITASDISNESLKILKRTFKHLKNINLLCEIADIENLPFDNDSFDVIASAGSLSYGLAQKVDSEIRRVLKPNGLFICVDSLNNNPLYRLNRYRHFLKGSRTKLTLNNMPGVNRLESLKNYYSSVELKYFGSISYLMPILSKIFGEKKSKKISDEVDSFFRIKRSAFKFVLVAKL